ncbi:hypothetical protein GQ600_3225 [Phytophthora cactorum]|nr:hypothetical protein GQ600_19834 [Phytophthora cactorum]KAF1775094.1 hypothetical protein GQ600_6978 [Phytophthora cactorum]KAF1790679.1 hypothetical protein GQ600_3225 [Phytophthora cactorum]
MLGKRVGELRARCRRHHSVACSVRQKSHRIRSQVSKWSATMRCLLSGRAAIIKTSTLAHYSRPMCYPRVFVKPICCSASHLISTSSTLLHAM